MKNRAVKKSLFDRIAPKVTRAVGLPAASFIAVLLVLGWALTGPAFHFSEQWQLVINTATTIITFLMVFIIQQTQNKDTLAIHLKLNELIASSEYASNRLIAAEDMSEAELQIIEKYFIKLAKLAESEKDVHATHSIDEAEEKHELKKHKQIK